MTTDETLNDLKRSLEQYREVILSVNKILEWQHNYHPAIIAAIVSFTFTMLWYWEPSVLTAVCIIAMIFLVTDHALQTLHSQLFGASSWTVVEERQFDDICSQLLSVKTQLNGFRGWLGDMKNERPSMHLLVTLTGLSVIAWFASFISNPFVSYILVMAVSLTPGLRKSGILQLIVKIPMQYLSSPASASHSKTKSGS